MSVHEVFIWVYSREFERSLFVVSVHEVFIWVCTRGFTRESRGC